MIWLLTRCFKLLSFLHLLWPNGWMDEDATWHGSRPQPRPHCVRPGLSSLPHERGTAVPLPAAHIYCGYGRQSQLLLSCCCTPHGRVSLGLPGHVLSPNNCAFAWGSGHHLIHASLGAPESITQTASGAVQPFLHSLRQSVVRLYNGPPLPP